MGLSWLSSGVQLWTNPVPIGKIQAAYPWHTHSEDIQGLMPTSKGKRFIVTPLGPWHASSTFTW